MPAGIYFRWVDCARIISFWRALHLFRSPNPVNYIHKALRSGLLASQCVFYNTATVVFEKGSESKPPFHYIPWRPLGTCGDFCGQNLGNRLV